MLYKAGGSNYTDDAKLKKVHDRNMEKARADLKILGMTCAMCVKSVENALTGLPGVSEVGQPRHRDSRR